MKLTDYPETIRPYVFHGVSLGEPKGDECVGDCPWCNKEGKFSVKISTGQWKCWTCGGGSDSGGGNTATFLQRLWALSFDATEPAGYRELVDDRRLLNSEALVEWGVCKSYLDDEWLVPGYGPSGKLTQLYRYVPVQGKRRLLATPTIQHGLFYAHPFDVKRQTIYVCEGPWDGMALSEVLQRSIDTDDGLKITANRAESMLEDGVVMAVPGTGFMGESLKRFGPLFSGKTVILFMDNDYPKNDQEPNGLAATKRAVKVLSKLDNPPLEIMYLNWGENGYSESFPNHFDVRDLLTVEK